MSPLVDELEEEVLLRFPPDDPAALVRAALVCKRWRRLVSGRGFRRRFCEFHRTPPMLGMFCNRSEAKYNGRFVATTAFRSDRADLGDRRAADVRHGRVLLREGSATLVVWDPITDEEWTLPFPPQFTKALSLNVTVLCSAAGAGGCDHLDCHGQPFSVVSVASVNMGTGAAVTFIYTYSSDVGAWSEPICDPQARYLINPKVRSALVGNTLYFGGLMGEAYAIIKYNMQLRQMSWIELPYSTLYSELSSLTTTEDGGLQHSIEDRGKLYIWSMKDANEVDATWEQNRVIKLRTLFPDGSKFALVDVVGSTDGLGTIFVRADDVTYAIDLKTYKVKKVYEDTVYHIIPYMSFYTPVALEADGTGEGQGPSAGGPSA